MTTKEYEKYHEAVRKATPIMQSLYRIIRMDGFDRITSFEILESALKCGMIGESFDEGGVDKDIYNTQT